MLLQLLLIAEWQVKLAVDVKALIKLDKKKEQHSAIDQVQVIQHAKVINFTID